MPGEREIKKIKSKIIFKLAYIDLDTDEGNKWSVAHFILLLFYCKRSHDIKIHIRLLQMKYIMWGFTVFFLLIYYS